MKTMMLILLNLGLVLRAAAGVLPPDAVVDGKTIAEWSVDWFRSFYPLGSDVSPMFDPDGRSALNGQLEGDVFFLGSGTGFEAGVITRTFTVPAGKYLLMPLLIGTVDNIDTFPLMTVEEMRDGIMAFIDNPRELHASIDGVPVPDLMQHRATTPVFNIEYDDADNYLTVVYGKPIVGLVDPVIGDGFWLMIQPLPPGQHVLRYGGAYALPFYSPTDIIAHIVVAPEPLQQKIETLLAQLAAAGLPGKRMRMLEVRLLQAGAAIEKENLRAGIAHLEKFQKEVHHQLARVDPALAKQLIQGAQIIIEQAVSQLEPRKPKPKKPTKKPTMQKRPKVKTVKPC